MASLVHHVGDQAAHNRDVVTPQHLDSLQVHQPDAPVVEAAWAALAACAQHQWGVHAIAAMGGFVSHCSVPCMVVFAVWALLVSCAHCLMYLMSAWQVLRDAAGPIGDDQQDRKGVALAHATG